MHYQASTVEFRQYMPIIHPVPVHKIPNCDCLKTSCDTAERGPSRPYRSSAGCLAFRSAAYEATFGGSNTADAIITKG
jgi:hypothetical protein